MTTQAISAGPVQIACSAKDSRTARKGMIIGGLLMFPIGFLAAILGLAAKAQFPDLNPTLALPQIIMSLDPFSSGLTLAALWAADVSTACTILLEAGTLISQDIYKRFINPGISDKNFVHMNRIVILLVGAVTLWMAFPYDSVYTSLSLHHFCTVPMPQKYSLLHDSCRYHRTLCMATAAVHPYLPSRHLL